MAHSATHYWLLALPWCRLTIGSRPKRNWQRSSKTCTTLASGCVTRGRSYSRLIPGALQGRETRHAISYSDGKPARD